MNPTAVVQDIHYPASDGMPMGETDWHITALMVLLDCLRNFFRERKDVYIASNMFLYYAQGDPKQSKAPDCMVIFGVENRRRRVFKTWEEGAVPSVIFELSSDETFLEDLEGKRSLYARLGVAEYYLFDPVGGCLDPNFRGFHLRDGVYEPLTLEADGGLTSPALSLRLVPEGQILRLIDPRTGRLVPTSEEKSEDLDEADRRFEVVQRRAEVEERLAQDVRRRAEAAERLAESAERLAMAERRRAVAAEGHAEAERRRAVAAEAEAARLRTLLARRSTEGGTSGGDPTGE